MKISTRRGMAILVLLTAVGLALQAPGASVSPNAAKAFGSSIADAVEKVMPSVVVIRTEAMRYRLAQDMYFGQLYRIPERLAGQGSGAIISKDGYVLTNSHVVDDAEEIEVVLHDGTIFPAELVGQDPHADLAVIRIKPGKSREFTAIEPADSDALRVGEFVVAIGSPFSLSSSVTLGIVSQKGRTIGMLPYEDFIQTDAAVNQGNSGGPLVDLDGKMVGLNTMIQTTSGGNIGISFAIPANMAMTVAEAIMRDGKWTRPWIGITMNETKAGVEVDDVIPDGPAAEGDLLPGDVLQKVNGRPIVEGRDVQRSILLLKVGDKAVIEVLRNGKKVEKVVRTKEMPVPRAFYRE
jgi:S1-C subfamily serine protease